MNEAARRARLLIALVVAFALQAAFGDRLGIRGARPELALCVLLVGALFVGPNTGATAGFATGLLEAAYTGVYAGSLLVSRSIVGYVVGALDQRIYRDSVLIAVLAALLGTAAAEALFFLFAPRPHALDWLLSAAGEVVYNGILAVPLYYVMRRVVGRRR